MKRSTPQQKIRKLEIARRSA